MLNCSRCDCSIGNDTIELADGSHLCTACFEARFPKVEETPKINLLGVISVLKQILIGSAVLAFCYGAYSLYNRQQQAEREERELAHQRTVQEAERTHRQMLQAEQEQIIAEQQRLATQLKRDAVTQARRDLAESERAAAIAARDKKMIEDLAKRKAVLPIPSYLSEPAPSVVEAPRLPPPPASADLKSQYSKAKKALSDALFQRAEDERKLAAFTTQYNTYAASANRLYAKYNGNFETGVRGITLRTIDTDRQGAGVEFEKCSREAQKATDSINAIKDEMSRRESTTADLKTTVLDLKDKLASAGETSIELNPTAPVNPFETPVGVIAQKTLYKKDGKTIRIVSAMAVGEEWQFKDADGKTGTLPKAEVDRIE